MNHQKRKINTSRVYYYLTIILMLLVVLNFNTSLYAVDFPFEENFEGDVHSFEIPDGSAWGVGEAHGEWTTFNGLKHLDNNIAGGDQGGSRDRYGEYSAGMGEWITLPENGKPYLSFWYKAGLFHGDKISLDIHYYGYYPFHYYIKHNQYHYDWHSRHCYWKKKTGKKKRLKVVSLKTYHWWKNTGAFHKWEKISLKRFRGKEVKVVFHERLGRPGQSKVFTVDDFRITYLPEQDTDGDGIPDEYDPTPNNELLPPVTDFHVSNDGGMFTHLEWEPLINQPSLVGYRIYREVKEGTQKRGGRHWYHNNMLNDGRLIDPDRTDFYDTDVDDQTTYTYKIVPVSKEGHEGEAVSVDITLEFTSIPFPYEESFDSVRPGFIIPEGSDWNIAEGHGDWNSFSGTYHLDSNPGETAYQWKRWQHCKVQAMMKYRVKIPEDSPSPVLSYWYKRTSGQFSNKLIIDIHYIKKYGNGRERERVRTYVRPYKKRDGTNGYAWDSISLRKFRGKEIWVTFSQWYLKPGRVNMFVIDDFRISQPSGNDQNNNDVPDEYETPMNQDMLPFVEDFFVSADSIGAADLSWLPIEGPAASTLAGYNVYRYVAGSPDNPVRVNDDPLPKESSGFTDLTMEHNKSYYYFVRAVSTGGVDGYSTLHEFISIFYKEPKITKHPENRTIIEREPVVFSVEAEGIQLSYQWQRDGKDIPGADESSYTIPSVSLSDNHAIIRCRVANSAGSVTSQTAELLVLLAPPVIVAHPSEQTVTEFDPAGFRVEAIGSFVTYQWQKNQMDIPGAIEPVYTLAEAPLSDHNARFRCVVKNDAGTVFSNEAVLTVNMAPPLILSQPVGVTILERQNAVFTINVRGSMLTYQWQRDDVDIPNAAASEYTLENARLSDNGAGFKCIVTNTAGTATSVQAVLTVNLAPPLIIKNPETQIITEFDPVAFEVETIGSFLRYQWQKNQVDIPGASSRVYNITETPLADNNARFRCVVANDAGSLTSDEAELTVNMAVPAVLTQPVDLTVTEFEPAGFSVVVKGSQLSYQWQKNQVDIPGAKAAVYNIVETPLSDHGAVFRCVVANDAGSTVSTGGALTVNLAAPKILTQPSDLTVTEFQAAEFSVSVKGSQLSYQWQKNQVDIPGAASATYTITETPFTEHDAVFRCVVTNAAGTVTTAGATLTVNRAVPRILTQPLSLTVTEFEPAQFSIQVKGTGLSYQWQKNGTDISGAGAESFTISETPITDHGAIFTCVVANDAGSVTSSEALLNVNRAVPRILTQPASLTVTEFEPAQFSIQAKGTGLSYQWQKDGADISGADSDSYTIVETSLTDNGAIFTCRVTNDAGSVTSGNAGLTVNQASPQILTHPVGLTVLEFTQARFTVSVKGSGLSYQWQKNGSDISGADSDTYTISETPLTDSGSVYTCVVVNDAGTVTSNGAALTVNQAVPRILVQPADLTVTEFESSQFSVTVKGSGLGYQWQKNGSDIFGAESHTYSMAETLFSDNAAVFTCKVTNAAGTVVSDGAVLTVNQALPVITVQPQDLAVTEKEPAEFTLTVRGSGLTYQWRKNGTDIQDADAAVYTIAEAAHTDQGEYQCVVVNDAGTVTSAVALLSVNLLPPVITDQPAELVVIEGDAATFSVTAQGTNLNYQWQKDNTDIVDAVGSVYTIDPAALGHTGIYRCRVYNTGGEVFSTDAELTVNPAIPENTTPVNNAKAVWDQGGVRLTWDPVSGVRFAVYRGLSETDIPALAETAASPYLDQSAESHLTYYYRFATIRDYTHPVTGDTVHKYGPLSDIVVLNFVPAEITINNARKESDGTFAMAVQATGPYDITGSYQGIPGTVRVTGAWSGTTITGSGGNNAFSLQLTSVGQWQITVARQPSGASATALLRLEVDDEAPELSIHGAAERTTNSDSITITGLVEDSASHIASVTLTNDQYSGQNFGAVVNAQGIFTSEMPLRPGINNIQVTASDTSGNSETKDVKVTLILPGLPEVVITSPAHGSTATQDKITVSGTVRSSLLPQEIRLELNGTVQFPVGANSEYTFSFIDVPLADGANTLTVFAQTTLGNVSAQTLVYYNPEGPGPDETEPPTVELSSYQPEIHTKQDHIVVSGLATSDQGIQSVTVNGQSVDMIGEGQQVSFETTLYFPGPDVDVIDVIVVVTDVIGKTTTVNYKVFRDITGPMIQVTSPGLQESPDVSSVIESPFILTGTVVEKHLSGFTINGQEIGLVPTASENEYAFEVGVALNRGENILCQIEAWDIAGNSTGKEYILNFSSSVGIEVITPKADSEFKTADAILDLEVTARVPGIAATDTVRVTIDNQNETDLQVADFTAYGTVNIPASVGSHILRVFVHDASDNLLAGTSVNFEIIDLSALPVMVERQEPENDSVNVEPNHFIAFYFNRPIDPQLLEIRVNETVHGLNYKPTESGADLTQISDVELVEVNKEREIVQGGMAHFPGNTMVAFYPEMLFGFNATIYVKVIYDSNELFRSSFKIRPLPTFITGFVTNHFMIPINGIEVAIPELDKMTVTNVQGNFGFGFGEPADKMIPPGRYKAVINPHLKNIAFGTAERWIYVEEGRINFVDTVILPVIDPKKPFNLMSSRQTQPVVFGDNELMLDVSGADLIFPSGRDEGNAVATFIEYDKIGYPIHPFAIPLWVFSIQPMGIEVNAQVNVTFKMPALFGSHDYVSQIGERVIIVGFNPKSMQIEPVGVGLVNENDKTVRSQGELDLKRLDFLGYSFVPPELQGTLERFANGEIDMNEMIVELQSY